MASTLLSSFTFLSILVLLSASIRPSSSDTEAMINKICIQARSYGICHRFFRNRVISSPSMDIEGLTHVALDESLSLVQSTHALMHTMRGREHDKNLRNLYWICESSYGVVADRLANADSAFGRREYRDLVLYIMQCDVLVSDCERVLGSRVAMLSKRNEKARQFISISLSAAGILYGNY